MTRSVSVSPTQVFFTVQSSLCSRGTAYNTLRNEMIKSHCESDTEWPAGSLVNTNHSLNRCCALLLQCFKQPVCVEGSETAPLTH